MKTKRLKPLRFLQKYGRLIIGGVIIAVVLCGAIFAPMLTDYDPEAVSLLEKKQPPSEEHVLGTDLYGRDMLSRILYGSRTTLIVALGVQTLVTLAGTILGLICGYYSKAEKFLMAPR